MHRKLSRLEPSFSSSSSSLAALDVPPNRGERPHTVRGERPHIVGSAPHIVGSAPTSWLARGMNIRPKSSYSTDVYCTPLSFTT
jgi:hypothetical protein